MKRYIAQFHKGGFPELYHVAERVDGQWVRIGEPMPYHAANDRARDLNQEPKPHDDWSPLVGWLGGLNLPTQP